MTLRAPHAFNVPPRERQLFPAPSPTPPYRGSGVCMVIPTPLQTWMLCLSSRRLREGDQPSLGPLFLLPGPAQGLDACE